MADAKLKEVVSSGVTEDDQMFINMTIETRPDNEVSAGFTADASVASVLAMAVLAAAGQQRQQIVQKSGGVENAQIMQPAMAPRISEFHLGEGERPDGAVDVVLILKFEGGFEMVLGLEPQLASQLRDGLAKLLANPLGFSQKSN